MSAGRSREAGEVVLIEDWAQNEFRALIRLEAFPDRYLYVSREVDGEIIALLDETQQTVQLYRQLELTGAGCCSNSACSTWASR
jgi:two-component system nitrogen regulation sensor histidine kinase NtrY